MAAATLTFSAISGEELQFLRSKAEVDVTLTMVASTSTYTNGGLADSSGFGAAWAVPFNIRPTFVQKLTPLRTSDFENAFDFEIDLTNRKVVLYGLYATPAEGEPWSEVPDANSIPNGTYTARIRIRGT
jgi:hypothetical protein